MPLLSPTDSLTRRPDRILVAGASGSGKTTVAARLAEALDLRQVELDGLYHGPGWVPRPAFEADVLRFAAEPRWVTEWQYSEVRDRLADRADLLVWLDLPRSTVLRQVVRRTVARRLTRRALWNGNVEPPLWTVVGNPDHIVRWSWRSHPETAPRVAALLARRPDLPVVRLRSRSEVADWVQRVSLVLSVNAARPASSRATGTRNGEQET